MGWQPCYLHMVRPSPSFNLTSGVEEGGKERRTQHRLSLLEGFSDLELLTLAWNLSGENL